MGARLGCLLWPLLLLAPRLALAQVPCGTINYLGECDGDTVRYCAGPDDLREVNCADPNPELGYGPNATCGLWDCNDDVDNCMGYWCVGREGAYCDYGMNLACDLERGLGCLDWECRPSQACDPANYAENCTGDVVSWCSVPRIWAFDCSEGGTAPYACGLSSVGQVMCLGLAGGRCDLVEGFECVAGLSCVANYCVAPDAGAVDAARPDTTRPDTTSPRDSARADTRAPDRTLPDTTTPRDSAVGVDRSGPDRGLGSDASRPADASARDLGQRDVPAGVDLGSGLPGRDSGVAGEPTDYVATAGCACEAAGLPVGLLAGLALVLRLARRGRRTPG